MRQEQYDRVVRWDRMARYPERRHVTEVPKIRGRQLHWSLRSVGMNPDSTVAAMTALTRRTGHMAKMHTSTKSVAAWKLREGERVSCSVHRSASEAMSFLETWLLVVVPNTRSFEGMSSQHVDREGGVSLPIANPLLFPSLEPRYERLNPRCSRPGLSMTLEIGGSFRSTPTTKRSDVVKSMLTGLGIPRVS